MNKILLVIALAIASTMLAPAPSLAVTYDFSFTGPLGTVTGEIDGLAPGYSGAVPLLIVDSAPAQFGVPTPNRFFTTDSAHDNIVVDAAGNVTSYDIFAEYQIYATLNLSSSCLTCNNFNADTPDGTITDTPLSFPTFTAVPSSPTPIPASAALFATMLGLVALIFSRRRNGTATSFKIAQRFA
jgi:hypothetical protein